MPVGTKKKSKINSKPFWFNSATGQAIPAGTRLSTSQKKNLEYFDSVLEFKIWVKLCQEYDCVRRQVEIPLLYSDEYFPSLTWKVDFTVEVSNKILLFEGKGEWILYDDFALSDFRKTLRLLQLKHPDYFNNLCIVSNAAWKLPGSNLFAIALKDL